MPAITIRVTEDRSVDAVLEASVAGDLWRLSQELVTLRPTSTRDCYRVTAGGKIGIVETSGVRIVVEPKIPLVNLLALLDPDSPVLSTGMMPDGAPDDLLLAALAVRLARSMVAHARRGLRRGYVAQLSSSEFLRGKLDVPAQMRQVNSPGVRFHVEFETLTPDIPANQFPKALAAELLDRFGATSPVGESLSDAIAAYHGVTGRFPTDTFAEAIQNVPGEDSECQLLELARLIQDGFDPRSGGHDSRPTLRMLDVHRVFETHVARGLKQRLGDFQVDLQPVVVMGSSRDADRANPLARPDLLLSRGTMPIWLIDTKWKISGGTPGPDDWRQVIAGMHVTGCPFGMLIYPGESHQGVEYGIPGGGSIIVQHVCVTGEARGCRESLERLADELRDRSGALEKQDPEGRNGEVQ